MNRSLLSRAGQRSSVTVTFDAAELRAAIAKLDHAAARLARWAEQLPAVLRGLNEALAQLDRVVGRDSEEARVFSLEEILADQKRIVR